MFISLSRSSVDGFVDMVLLIGISVADDETLWTINDFFQLSINFLIDPLRFKSSFSVLMELLDDGGGWNWGWYNFGGVMDDGWISSSINGGFSIFLTGVGGTITVTLDVGNLIFPLVENPTWLYLFDSDSENCDSGDLSLSMSCTWSKSTSSVSSFSFSSSKSVSPSCSTISVLSKFLRIVVVVFFKSSDESLIFIWLCLLDCINARLLLDLRCNLVGVVGVCVGAGVGLGILARLLFDINGDFGILNELENVGDLSNFFCCWMVLILLLIETLDEWWCKSKLLIENWGFSCWLLLLVSSNINILCWILWSYNESIAERRYDGFERIEASVFDLDNFLILFNVDVKGKM